jgi:hypothetical protein
MLVRKTMIAVNLYKEAKVGLGESMRWGRGAGTFNVKRGER